MTLDLTLLVIYKAVNALTIIRTVQCLCDKQVSLVISHRPVPRIKLRAGEASFTFNATLSGTACQMTSDVLH